VKNAEYQEKFENIVAFIEKNRKFPEFDEQIFDDFKKENIKTTDFFPCWLKIRKNRWFYEQNFMVFNENFRKMMQNKEFLGDKMILKWQKFCMDSLEYQRKYLVLPTWAKWFNKNTEIIFQYLKSFNE